MLSEYNSIEEIQAKEDLVPLSTDFARILFL